MSIDQHVNAIVADILVNGLEDAEYNGTLTREQVEAVYLRLGSEFDLKDLLHRPIFSLADMWNSQQLRPGKSWLHKTGETDANHS